VGAGKSERRGHGGTYAAFDGLRATAALLVISYHAALASGWTRTGSLAPLASALKGGVTVFFLISAFLLYLPYARAIRDRKPLPDWRTYARRRLVRIVPAYWFALTMLAALGLVSGVFTASWWRYYGFTQIYNTNTIISGLGVAWSLCVEITFYISLPFIGKAIAALVRRRSGTDRAYTQLSILAVIGLGSLALRALGCHSLTGQVPASGAVLQTALPGTLDWFALGMALAVIASTWETEPGRVARLHRLARHGTVCWLLAALFFLAGVVTQHGDLFLTAYGPATHLALGLAATLLILPATVHNARSGPLRILTTRSALWLGTISYGIYLWHDQVIGHIQGEYGLPPTHPSGLLSGLWLLVAGVTGAICLGAASWYLVEQPAQLLARCRLPRQPTAYRSHAAG
jgi:peptidoglycan/LPS O-acetylase OafA/YrhL